MHDALIAVPSKGRCNWLKSKKYTTFDIVCSYNKDKIAFIEEKEVPQYKEYINDKGWALHSIPNDTEINYVHDTYNYIINYAHAQDYEYLFLFDDDLVFTQLDASTNDFSKYDRITDLDKMISICTQMLCHEMPFITIPYAFKKFAMQRLIDFNANVQSTYIIHVPTFIRYGIDFSCKEEIWFHCDTNLILKLMRCGFLSAQLNIFMHSACGGGFNSPGGCSLYRTQEKVNASIAEMSKIYGKYFVLREGLNKYGWRKYTVYTKKAFDKDLFYFHFHKDAEDVAKRLVSLLDAIYSKELNNG